MNGRKRFTRRDSEALIRLASSRLGQPASIKVCVRLDAEGEEQIDQRLSPHGADLHHAYALDYAHGWSIAPGAVLDLCVYENGDDGAPFVDLILTLDAKWNGTAWEICEPRAPKRVVTEAPR